MKYFKLLTTIEFYDGHGCPDMGGRTLSVTKSDEFRNSNNLAFILDNQGVELISSEYLEWCDYDEDDYIDQDSDFMLESDLPDSIDLRAEDGYNFDMSSYNYKEITESEYNELWVIINEYSEHVNKF